MITLVFNILAMMLLAFSLVTCGSTVLAVSGLCTIEARTKTIHITGSVIMVLTALLFGTAITVDVTDVWLKYTPYTVEYCTTDEIESIKKELTDNYKKTLKVKYVLKKVYYCPVTETTNLILTKKYLIPETDTI